MRLYSLLFAGFLSTTTLLAATDPFVGTWVYNAQKTPKPTIQYTIQDLGGDRYALTGSTNETTEIKADGIAIKSPSGDTVSFKKLDGHTWQMDRTDNQKMVRTYTVSADDKTLTLNDVFTDAKGGKFTTLTTYARLAPGHSIYGQWQSVSMKEESSGEPMIFVIEAFGTDGLSFISPAEKHHLDMNFDGKPYFEQGEGAHKGQSTSGKRVNPRLITSEEQVDGKPDAKDEFKISEDGKTLTVVSRPIKSSAVFTMVFDKR